MTARLSDAIRTTLNFDRTAVPKTGATPEEVEEHKWFCDTFVHLISLFHGVALATLRGDYNMENLVVHDSLANAPPNNVHMLNRADLRAAEAARQPSLGDSPQHAGTAHRMPSWAAGSACAGGRSRRGGTLDGGYSNMDKVKGDTGGAEGGLGGELPRPTKALKQSRKWAGSKSFLDYFVLRTSPEHAQHIYRSMKLPVIGGLTQAEGVALGAFSTSGDHSTALPALDLGIHGIMLANGTYAPAPTERVHTIASWIHQCLIDRIHAGGVRALSSIQSRVYQSLADAFVAFEQCQKLTDTQFPFPWVQAVNIALLLLTLAAPIAVVGFIHNAVVATGLTFMAVATHVMLNEVASDIEDPFLYDPNELPLPQMQYKLNERLLAVLHSDRPVAFTDVGDLSGPGNTVQLRDLQLRDCTAGAPAGEDATPKAVFVPNDTTGSSPKAPTRQERLGPTGLTQTAAAAAAAAAAAVAASSPPASMTRAPSRAPSQIPSRKASGASDAARHSGSPAAPGPYLITTPDGVTIPLPQLGSQRSRQSDRPAPSDARDLRQYSTANDIPATMFARMNSTWLQVPSARYVSVGSSPRAEAVRSPAPRRGSVQLHGQLSLDEGRAGPRRSTEGHSMHGAACAGAQPTLPPEPACTAFDVRPSAAGARTRQTGARGKAAAQTRRGGKGGVRAASEKKQRGRSGGGQGTAAAEHADAGNSGPQHAAQHVAQHGSGAARRGRAADEDQSIHSMLRAAPVQSDRGSQQTGAGGGAAAEASAVADAPNERAAAQRLRRASTALTKVVRGVTSALHPHSTQHGSSIGPQKVSVAQGSTPAAPMLPLGRVSLKGERLRAPSPQHMAGSAPAARPNPDAPASLTRENLALCADLPDQSTQRGFNTAYSPEIWPICTPQHGTQHGAQHGDGSRVRAVHRGPYSVPQPSPQHSTQRSPQLEARHSTPHAAYLALPGLPQMVGSGADSSSSSSLNTPPQDRTLGVQPPSTTGSVHRSMQRGAQRELPQVSLSGGIVPSPGFPAE